jgi:hypothetical protein
MTRKRWWWPFSAFGEGATKVWSQRQGKWGLLILAAAPMYIGIDAIFGSFPELVQHLIITVLAVAAVHLLEKALSEGRSVAPVQQALRDVLKEDGAVLGPARELGISEIFVDRKSAVPSILSDLAEAKAIVLMLGVTFSEELELSAILERTPPSVKKKVRIALLDPLRSPAVFRTYLEADPARRVEIHRASSDAGAGHPYFDERLYRDFNMAMSDFAHVDRAIVHNGVRFYRHDPSCWMIVVDDVVYFQPYNSRSNDRLAWPPHGQPDASSQDHAHVRLAALREPRRPLRPPVEDVEHGLLPDGLFPERRAPDSGCGARRAVGVAGILRLRPGCRRGSTGGTAEEMSCRGARARALVAETGARRPYSL